MSRAVIILSGKAERDKALQWIALAPVNTRIEFKRTKRSIPQNDLMWAHLTEIAQQKTHHGIRLSPDDWKKLFLNALDREMRLVPNLEGTGFVALNNSSSDLSKEEMGDLIEIIKEWGGRNGVQFGKEAA